MKDEKAPDCVRGISVALESAPMTSEFTPAPAAPPPKLRWYQYRLRSLLLLMLLVSLGMSWLAVKMKAAREQKAAVKAITKLCGAVGYDYQKDWSDTTSQPPGPAWLRNWLGEDLFVNVRTVELAGADFRQPLDGDFEASKGVPPAGIAKNLQRPAGQRR